MAKNERVKPDCGHLLCDLIDSSCSLATHRSRGCRPGLAEKSVALEVFEEVRALLAIIDPDSSPTAGPITAADTAAATATAPTTATTAATTTAATAATTTAATATTTAAATATAADTAAATATATAATVDDQVRKAAIRLAAIVRREALEDRNLLAHVRADEPELAPALARLCVRRR